MTEQAWFHGDYTGLSLAEALFIQKYLKTYDNAALAEFVRDNASLSDGFKLFLHDTCQGKYRRGRGENKQDYSERDWQMYCHAKTLMKNEGKSLEEAVRSAAKAINFRGGIAAAKRSYYQGEKQFIAHDVHLNMSRLMVEQGLSLDEAAEQVTNALNEQESKRTGRGKKTTFTKERVIELFDLAHF